MRISMPGALDVRGEDGSGIPDAVDVVRFERLASAGRGAPVRDPDTRTGCTPGSGSRSCSGRPGARRAARR
ncbi:hypothetical protein [Streptomyces virginiae]|uniref:hypothetical protein n=1 Tax=Streptomyces virginiae TaxID=1961 RepID=UPI00224E7EA6|nr:hypothetical protein [Streptomyces virginiae]MCX4959265.1 hypothetical protein [Streptomyces virginiae]MCX5178080.1 hypothetical protein [Streptomyces virginiae]